MGLSEGVGVRHWVGRRTSELSECEGAGGWGSK